MSNAVDDLGELYTVIGFVVTTWPWVEQNLDLGIAAARLLPGGRRVIPTLPIGLRPKIVALQVALKALPQLRPLKAQGLQALASVQRIKDRRHDLVHSVLASQNAPDGVYRYRQLSVEHGEYKFRQWKFNIKSFPVLKQRIEAAVADSLWLASAIVAVHPASTKP
jgi:hypothetical protein